MVERELGMYDDILARLAQIVQRHPGIPFDVAWKGLRTRLSKRKLLYILLDGERRGSPLAARSFQHEGQRHLVDYGTDLPPQDLVALANENVQFGIIVVLLPDKRLRSSEIRDALAARGWKRSAQQVRQHLNIMIKAKQVIEDRGPKRDHSNRNFLYVLEADFAILARDERFARYYLPNMTAGDSRR